MPGRLLTTTRSRQADKYQSADRFIQERRSGKAGRRGQRVRIPSKTRASLAWQHIVPATRQAQGKPAVLIIIFRQPGANIIDTVDRVYALMPQLAGSISPAIHLDVVMDRTTTIRASVRDIEITLLISVFLVILVVFAFLRTVRATIIPSIAVPLSLIGTFAVMYACITAWTIFR